MTLDNTNFGLGAWALAPGFWGLNFELRLCALRLFCRVELRIKKQSFADTRSKT